MEENFTKFNLVIDFDSTFIKLEALDELAKIALANNPQKEEIVAEIAKITQLGMSGELSFPESLQSRLKLFSVNREHIDRLIERLKHNISASFLKNREFFWKNQKNIYIISGGFVDYIWPIVGEFGIVKEHVLANKFIFQNDRVVGIDQESFLAQEAGKVRAVQDLGIKEVVVVGDGWTDYEIKSAGSAKKFIAFSENVSREKVTAVADLECNSFDQVISSLQSIS